VRSRSDDSGGKEKRNRGYERSRHRDKIGKRDTQAARAAGGGKRGDGLGCFAKARFLKVLAESVLPRSLSTQTNKRKRGLGKGGMLELP